MTTKLIHDFYNMDTNAVELTYNDGSVLTIDCEEVENHYDVTNGQMADLDIRIFQKRIQIHKFCDLSGFLGRVAIIGKNMASKCAEQLSGPNADLSHSYDADGLPFNSQPTRPSLVRPSRQRSSTARRFLERESTIPSTSSATASLE